MLYRFAKAVFFDEKRATNPLFIFKKIGGPKAAIMKNRNGKHKFTI